MIFYLHRLVSEQEEKETKQAWIFYRYSVQHIGKSLQSSTCNMIIHNEFYPHVLSLKALGIYTLIWKQTRLNLVSGRPATECYIFDQLLGWKGKEPGNFLNITRQLTTAIKLHFRTNFWNTLHMSTASGR